METIVAEKLDAILYLMEASSRMKDYYDIYYLAISKNFNGNILRKAIHNTFKNRKHLDFIKNIHDVHKFKGMENLNSVWNRFIEEEIVSLEINNSFLDTKIFTVSQNFLRVPNKRTLIKLS